MTHTVGIYAATGNIGQATLPHLLKLSTSSAIKLVVLHRPGSKVDSLNLPVTVETRAVDVADNGDRDALASAIKDIDLIISTVGFEGWTSQFAVIEAIGKANNNAVFIAANYGIQWDVEDIRNPHMAFAVGPEVQLKEAVQKQKVNYTIVGAGMFTSYFFGASFLGTNVKENSVQANTAQLANKVPLASLEYIGAAIGQLASESPASIANKQYSIVEHWVTGHQLVDLLAEANGTAPALSNYTESDEAALFGSPPFGSIIAGYKKHWQSGVYDYPNEIEVKGWSKRALSDLVKQFK